MSAEEKRRLSRAAMLLGGIFGGLALMLYVLRPPCVILHFTGLYCPGCGAQRMLRAALRGDFSAAWGYNPFLFILTPFVLVFAGVEFVRYVKGKPSLIYRRSLQLALAGVIVLAIGFMVLRNLPGMAGLRP